MKRFYYFLLLVIVLHYGAGDQNEKPSLIAKGTSSFVYQNENLNKGRPITVYSYLPTKYKDSSQILIVMHGNGRTAENYRDAWIDSAERNNALLLVPHFSRENGFPEDDQYNMGNMFKMDPDEKLLSPNPESEWSYSLIDPVFDFVVEHMKNQSTGYLIYGHSAGSQFLHRLLFFKPGAKIKKAVCANAGWYTMPDFDQIFPYGLKETQCSEESLRKLFAKKVTILLGDMDTDPDHSSLRRTPQAMQQGAHRFQRGHTFYRACKQMAEKLGIQFLWDLEIVSGVAHSNRQMAPSAAKVLFEASDEADYDPSLFSALRWRNIGPNRGGRSIACGGSSSRPMEYYFGATGGGLWKTTDGGITWRPVTDSQIMSSSVGAIAVSESNPDVVYIGMGEVQLRNDILQGDGIYKSSDGGKTWTHMGLEKTQVISRVRTHPQNPDIVYAAVFGHPYGPNEDRGVYRSKDGGKSWQKILFRDDRSGAVDLAMARQNPDILFAAIWQVRIWPGGAILGLAVSRGNQGSGLFKSTDGGDSWSEITRNPGLPKGPIGKIGVSISGGDSNRVYALVEAEDGGVFRSDDGGSNWIKVNDEGGLRQRPSYFNRIYADPIDRNTVYVLNFLFYKSTDGGKTFMTIRTPHLDNHDLWIAPDDPQRMIESNDGGGNVSFNGGKSWTEQDFPTAQFYHVATTRDIPYHVCGAQQDANTICVPSNPPLRSSNPIVGRSLSGPIYGVGGGESGTIAPHPHNPDLFFATGPQSLITRFDRRTGLSQARDIQVSPRWDPGPDRERFNWTIPIAFSHHDPDVLYVSSQHLWRTENGGMEWEKISPDMSRSDSQDQDNPKVGSIFTIAPSYHDSNTIWTGTDDGLVHITRDTGQNWQEVTPPDLPEFSRISQIEASPHNPGTAYIAAKRYELDDRAPYIFKTDDYGRNWQKIVKGIPSNDFVHAVREDPKRKGLLYAGTEHGVYVSFDAGGNWQSLSLNLPNTQVPDLVVEENDLVIATHGRSFYILDDIGPLRQISPQIKAAAFHLFQPRDAIRRLNYAVIDYILKTPAQNVVIEILDSDGEVIRTFSSLEEEDKRGESRKQKEASFGRPSLKPSRNAGLNRFNWDLRYEGATVFPGMIMWVGSPIGPIAAPGKYQVRVTADGETQTQPFRVVRDPRPKDLTDSDIQEQFSLALKVRDRISEANEAILLIRDVKRQVRDRIKEAENDPITSLGESLNKTLSGIEGKIYQVHLRSQLDAIKHPIMLNNRLANLQLSIETGDRRPTKQAYAAFQKLSSELDVLLGKLNNAIKTEAFHFNRLLADHNLEPVKTSR